MGPSEILVKKYENGSLNSFESKEEWRHAWNVATSLEQHLSLIYWGLRLSEQTTEQFEEQVCFYLDIADGYRFRGIESPHAKHAILPVAQAAWKELCLRFFSERDKDKLLTTEDDIPLVQKLMWFFDPDRNNNIPYWDPEFTKDVNRIGHDFFAYTWIPLLWSDMEHRYGIRKEDKPVLKPVYESLNALRPKFMPILMNQFNGIERLLNLSDRENILPYLREKALEERWVSTDSTGVFQERRGPYKTLQEAIQHGRREAEVCLILETRLKKKKTKPVPA